MSKVDIINITVDGPTGCGKSHVLAVIEKALKAEYGVNTQVASHCLATERNMTGGVFTEPRVANVVFILHETNQPHGPNKNVTPPAVLVK